jgi:hypothetical protein
MLGVGGRFASAKGMVRVPNLSGLSRGAAQSAIEAAGLIYGGFSDTVVADSSLEDKVANQNILPDTLVDYETTVSITRYRYEAPFVPPSYPPKPSDDGQIIPGNCVATTSTTTEAASCEGTTLVTPLFKVYERIDKRKVYVENPSNYTWTLTLQDQPAVECYYEPLTPRRDDFHPSCVTCTTVVDSKNYQGANTNCSSGQGYYRTDIYPSGCVPPNKTVSTGCVPPPEPTLENTSFGNCTQSGNPELSSSGINCYFNGNGIRTRTRTYSDGSTVVDRVCCTYTPPAPACPRDTLYGTYSSCTATGLAPGTKTRTVTEIYTDCSRYTYQQTVECCIAFCSSWSSWSPTCSGNGPGTRQNRYADCVSSLNCNLYDKSETRCCTGSVTTFGPCNLGSLGNRRRYRYVTTYFSDCTDSTSTTLVAC